ncbi:von Willebrand factor type A domain-containing protein [Geodermatophilus dictyosporus]|uniref:von Willebrand factor type A domain-containing protein n=1 Tax=Geodermatophilus dictyosporus TaxID=1523247 RepID=A0A1I5JRQ0_9ACTN|nr:vWA domain-containing protein [Geodermatophilus dictyosporus]SFO75016.1 von Willebrand factor type A domain-containing protein [Geodermatophilus dictyosporus]
MRPLRRRPKQLTEQPTLYEPSRGGGGMALSSGDRRRTRTPATRAGGTASGTTDEPADLITLADLATESGADQLTRARARQIARRLSVPRPPRDQRSRRGVGELASLSWSGGSDELDLERTLEAIVGIPYPEGTDLVVRERVRQRRSVVLVVDVSGSMKGERVRTAAATVGALAGELARDSLAVVAFWSDAAVLVRMGEQVAPLAVLDLLLRVPTQGLTNVSFALDTAAHQLDGVPPRDARVLLLSDCVHNAGPDPRLTAARLPRLDVLVDTSGEQDVELGRDLARLGRGRARLVRDHRDVAAALSAVFTD